jgi:hypothetical protein
MITGNLVSVADRVLAILPLSIREESALVLELRRRVKESFGKGGYFERSSVALSWLKDQNRMAEFATAVQRIAELEAQGELPSGDPVDLFRQTATGVAIELFFRTRRTHPEVSLAELQSIITDANAIEVHLEILRALTEKKTARPSETDAGDPG